MEVKETYSPFIHHNLPNQKGIVVESDDIIKKLYPDVNEEVSSYIFERVLKIEGDEVIMKWNIFRMHRRLGKRFFSKRFQSQYLKINISNGNFLTVNSSGSSKKRRNAVIRVNSFSQLQRFYEGPYFTFQKTFLENLRNYVCSDGGAHYFDNSSDSGVVTTLTKNYPEFNTIGGVMDFFTEKKKLKTPDFYYNYFLTSYYPTEKFLKKNDRKLIDSVLDRFGVKSKYSIRLVHKLHGKIKLYEFIMLYKILGGSSNMANLNDNIFHSNNGLSDYRVLEFRVDNKDKHRGAPHNFELKENEKSNLIKVINSSTEKQCGDLLSHLIRDHLGMIKNIRKYDPSVSINATTFRGFMSEHAVLSRLNSEIEKGYELCYEYDEMMLFDIEKPITHDGITFYPHVLKNEGDYREEGRVMHHCVYTYLEQKKSIIISVRNKDGSDRVTCEFTTDKGELIQAKHFNNRQPPEEFDKVIYMDLVMKCHLWAKKGKLKRFNEFKKPLTINGITIEIREPSMDMYLPF